jgi:hypothetical protein
VAQGAAANRWGSQGSEDVQKETAAAQVSLPHARMKLPMHLQLPWDKGRRVRGEPSADLSR